VLETYIPFLPKGAEPINNHVAIYHPGEKIEFLTASGPIYSCRESDTYAVRLALHCALKATEKFALNTIIL
jgi:hypothetical protein